MFKTRLKPVKKFRLRRFKTFKTYGREAPGETWFRTVQGQAKFDNPALVFGGPLLPNANHFISGGFGPRARRPARCGPLDGDRCPNGGTAVMRCVDSGNSRDGWVYEWFTDPFQTPSMSATGWPCLVNSPPDSKLRQLPPKPPVIWLSGKPRKLITKPPPATRP